MKLFLTGFLSLIFIQTFFNGCSQSSLPEAEIRGVYGDPKPLWDKGHHLAELGVNAIFVNSGSINPELMKRARNEGLKVFAEFPTLNGKGYIENHPEAWAINEKGEQVEAASWFMGVCPTEPGFRKYRFDQLRNLLEKFDIDGVWMDYVHWHAQFEDPEPILPETCFCENCLSSFSQSKGIKLPEGDTPLIAEWILNKKNTEWRNWRCEVIAEWAEEMRSISDELKPGILLGIYHCPWNDEEFDGARRRILGLDYDLLLDYFDVFSPMVYHARMGRSPEWVADNISWFSTRIKAEEENAPKIWPIVQAYNNPYTVSAAEFEKVLKGGLTSPASGVMMFTTRAVADDDEKLEVMKKVYKNASKK